MTIELLDSSKAISLMGFKSINLLQAWLTRHPEYRPKLVVGGSLAWTTAEIQAVTAARAGRERGGMPTHKGPRRARRKAGA